MRARARAQELAAQPLAPAGLAGRAGLGAWYVVHAWPPPHACTPAASRLLAVLLEPGQEDLVEFLAQHRVRVVASLPCYSAGALRAWAGGWVDSHTSS